MRKTRFAGYNLLILVNILTLALASSGWGQQTDDGSGTEVEILVQVLDAGSAGVPAGRVAPAGNAGGSQFTLDFGNVELGNGVVRGVSITSIGDADVTDIEVGDVTGADAGRFEMFEDNCTGEVLPPGDSCVIWLEFTPIQIGPAAAQFVTTSTAKSSPLTTHLMGAGIIDDIFQDRFQGVGAACPPNCSHSFELLKDINPGPDGIEVTSSNSAESGGLLYFVVFLPETGFEPWVSDGTEQGTRLLKDIRPGTRGGGMGRMTPYQGKMLFVSNDGAHGLELWISDGTEKGTRMLKNIAPGDLSSNPSGMIEYKGLIYFAADDFKNGNELWVTDGTEAGTQLFKDISPGSASGNPRFFYIFDDLLYFQAHDPEHGTEIWRTDGTPEGTELALDIRKGPFGSSPSDFIEFDGKLFFTADVGVNFGRELWVTDGSEAGTRMVKDINPGSASSRPSEFIIFDGRLLFTADDGVHGRELWSTDGTKEGTELVADIWPGPESSSPRSFAELNGKLFFRAFGAPQHASMWQSDGTAEGTSQFMDIDPGFGTPVPWNLFTPYRGKLFFNRNNLWSTDGTVSGTAMIPDTPIAIGGGGTGTRFRIIHFNDALYFPSGIDPDVGVELYRYREH